MKRRPRIYYTETDKALMQDRWQQGESLNAIARLFDRHHNSVRRILAGFMSAFDRNTGALLWQTCVEASCPGPDFFSGIVGNPLIKGNTVYVGTLSGSLVALDAKTGAVNWIHTPGVSPTVFGLRIDSVWGDPTACGTRSSTRSRRMTNSGCQCSVDRPSSPSTPIPAPKSGAGH